MTNVIALDCLQSRPQCVLLISSFLAYVGSIVVIACNARSPLAHSVRGGVTTLAFHIGQAALRLATAPAALHTEVLDGQSSEPRILRPATFLRALALCFSPPSPKGACLDGPCGLSPGQGSWRWTSERRCTLSSAVRVVDRLAQPRMRRA